jgi:streptomycin 3"-adenylyltransferase
MSAFTLRPANTNDASGVAWVYAPYVINTAITFEEMPPTAGVVAVRTDRRPRLPWWVAVEAGEIVGYAHASWHRSRAAYRWAVDVSIYLAGSHWAKVSAPLCIGGCWPRFEAWATSAPTPVSPFPIRRACVFTREQALLRSASSALSATSSAAGTTWAGGTCHSRIRLPSQSSHTLGSRRNHERTPVSSQRDLDRIGARPMTSVERPPTEVLEYAARLTDQLLSALDGDVYAVYLHGSAVLGGWRAGVSDVDVMVVLPDDLRPDSGSLLASAAASTVSACRGTGLEMSAVSRAEAAAPRPPWRFVAYVRAAERGKRRVVFGAAHLGDPNLILHYAACRSAGWPVFGPPAATLIGPLPRRALLDALARELTWGLEQGSAPYALLNACRALLYLQDRQLVGKTTGGQWALDQGLGPGANIVRALAAQSGIEAAGALTDADVEFVQATIRRLTTAGKEEQAPAG